MLHCVCNLYRFICHCKQGKEKGCHESFKKNRSAGLDVGVFDGGICHGQGTTEESYYKGIEYAVNGEFKEAKKEFEKALKTEPFNTLAKACKEVTDDVIDQVAKKEAAIHFFKGADYANRKMWDDSIAEFTKSIEIDPRYVRTYNNRGLVYAEKDQYDRAISDYSRAIEIDPRYAATYSNQGMAYDAKGQYDRAISDYNRAIEIDPRDPIAYYNLGVAYVKKDQYDRAISDYSRAIEIDPTLAEAYNNRAVCYYLEGRYNKAQNDVYEAQKLSYQVHPGFLKALREASRWQGFKSANRGKPTYLARRSKRKS